jgi:hypothetical protein
MFSQWWEADPAAPAFALRGDTSIAARRPCVSNLSLALRQLPRRGRRFSFDPGSSGPVGGLRRHWQGIQRLSSDSTTVLYVSRSGGDRSVLVVGLDSVGDAGPLVSDSGESAGNLHRMTIGTLPYDSGFGHAGGLALLGHVLAVPMDGSRGGRVVFYDVSDPSRPTRIGALDPERTRGRGLPRSASAVGLTRLTDGRYLLVVGVRSSKALDFYLSRDTLLGPDNDHFRRVGVIMGLDVGGFQHLALLTQCDGAIFLVGTHNTAVPPPSRGRDHLHWYRLQRDRHGDLALRKQGEHWIVCAACNFGAAAGLYLTPAGTPVLYATEFWTHGADGRVAVEEFWP